MRIAMTIYAAFEIFQQLGVVWSKAMAVLTIMDIAMLICVTDNTGQGSVLEF